MKLSRRFTVTALPAAVILFSGQAPAQQMGGMGPGWQMPSPYSGMFGSMGNVYSPYYRQFHAPGMAGMSGMSGMAGSGQATGQVAAQPERAPQPPAWPASAVAPPPLPGIGSPGTVPYPSPYQGMFGSMGNIDSPYYRQFHSPGMAGMPGMAGSSGQGQGQDQARAETSSPGMRQPPAWPASAVVPPPLQGSGSSGTGPYPSPYQGMFGSMGNVYSPYYRQFHPPGMSGSRETMPGSGM